MACRATSCGCCGHYGVSIRTAKVQTLGHEVVDVFYVDHREPARVPRQLLRSEGDELRALLLAAAAPPAG